MPALAGLAATAALLDLVLRRGLLRVVGASFPHADRLAIEPFMRVLMNTIGIASIVVIADATSAVARRHDVASLARRISVTGLVLALLPCLGIATFLPTEHTTFPLVFIASLLGHVLAAQLSLGAFERGGDRAARVAGALVLVASLGAAAWLVLSVIGPGVGWTWSYDAAGASRSVGELAWALAPAMTLVALVLRDPRGPRSKRLQASMALALALAALFVRTRAYVGSEYATLLYGALHAQALADGPAIVYALVVGLGVGAFAHGCLSGNAVDRQLGHASAMLLAAGFAPRAPVQLGLFVAGAALHARALIDARRSG